MALSTNVPANNIGIEGMVCTKHPNFTNPTYRTKKKLMLHSTATPGATAGSFYKRWNGPNAHAGVEFFVDWDHIYMYLPIGTGGGKGTIKTWHCGSGKKGSGNNTHVAAEMCEPIQTQLIPINFATQSYGGTYNRKYTIQRIQMELKYLGHYKGNIDGVFGANTKEAVLSWQKATGQKQTGQVDRKNLAKLAARKGSYAAYDVEGATEQFNGVYNNAVKLFGWLCKFLGAKPSEIICHSEGCKLGIAGNHGDVMHWFPYHGRDMDMFRKDVQDWIDNKFVYLGTIPAGTKSKYAQNVDKLVSAGIITSPDYWYDVEKAGEVNNQFVMALLRTSGAKYCRKFSIEDCALPVIKAVAPTFNYDDYVCECDCDKMTTAAVDKALRDCLNILKGGPVDTIMTSTQVVEAFMEMGIITSKELWIGGMNGTAEVSKSGHFKYLLIAVAEYLCTKNYTSGVDAVKKKSGMNSEAYWKGGNFSAANTVHLINALASPF